MSSSAKGRKRSSNFGTEEELLVLDEVAKLKNIIECKTTNRLSSTDKNDAWKKVCDRFNSKNKVHRSLEQIKSKYENLKTKARKQAAGLKKDYKGTGGGPAFTPTNDVVVDAVLDIINIKTVYGLPSQGDSDAVEFQRSSSLKTEIYLNEENIEHNSIIVIGNEESVSKNIEVTDIFQEVNLVDDVNMDNTTPTLNKVKRAIGKDIVEESEKAVTWSTYTTQKLRQPPSKRLRPKILNPVTTAKEEYYKSKTELIALERENSIRKEAREEVEHQKRVELMALQIELTKQQLKNNK